MTGRNVRSRRAAADDRGGAGTTRPAGQDGTDGTDGPDGIDVVGVDGVDGIDGMNGVSGHEIVTQVAQWGGGGGFRELGMSGPPGKKGFGYGYNGGYFTAPAGSVDEAEINALLLDTAPVDGGTGWEFFWAGDFTGVIRSYEHFLFCAIA
jgi:hypothetical protein